MLARRLICSIFKQNKYFICKINQNNLTASFKFGPAINSNARFKYHYKPFAEKSGAYPSRLHPGSMTERAEDYVELTLSERTNMSHEDWDDFKKELFLESKCISEENFGGFVMNSLLAMNKLEMGHSFLKYLEKSNLKPNYLTYLIYITLCSKNHRAVGQDIILENLEKVKHNVDKSPVLDMKTAEYMIQGLCATDRWRESFVYIDKLTNPPSLTIRNALACAAIRNGDEFLAWEILNKIMKPEDIPSDRVFEEFFLVILNDLEKSPAQAILLLQKVFQFMQMKDIIVSENVIKLIQKFFERHPSKWHISYTKVSRNGSCEACGHSLKLLELTADEFRYLKQSFFERVLKKSDLFINTTEAEFQYYLNFIDRHKPFHVVVDGLNAAYTYDAFPKSKAKLAAQLLKIVKKLAGSSKKVLVMGRKHMRYWPSSTMKTLASVSKLFYTDNISQDDPFLLYAALASGPHTLFFSLDLMRDHISRLDDPYLIQLFKRWQQSHQIFFSCSERQEIKFIPPLGHSIHVQGKMDDGWHIPFYDKTTLEPYEELNNWMCVQRDLDL